MILSKVPASTARGPEVNSNHIPATSEKGRCFAKWRSPGEHGLEFCKAYTRPLRYYLTD